MPTSRAASRWLAGALGALCLVALALRVWGLGYGLPAVYNPDEVSILDRALGLTQNGLNPKNFLYPTFYFYALLGWEGLYFLVGRVTGAFHSVADLQRVFFVDPSRLYLAGRWLSALCGTATVWATYRLGARLFDRAAGLAAALFIAVAPFAVRDAHYIKHDVPVTLLIALAMLAAARLVVEPRAAQRRGPWIAAGALAGLAMSTHYYAIFVALPVVVAATVRRNDVGCRFSESEQKNDTRRRFSDLALAGAAATAAFFIASPFIPLNLPTVMRDLIGNRQIVVDRAVAGAGAFSSLGAYASMLWHDAIGWPVVLMSGVGLAVAVSRGWRRTLLLVSFAGPFLLFIANTAPATRYLDPVLPVLAILAGLALTRAASTRRGAWASGILVVAAALPAARLSVLGDQFFRQTDTRTLAQNFIEREIPPGATILLQPYSVQLRQSRDGLIEALRAHLGAEGRASVKFQKQLDLSPYPSPAYRTLYLGEKAGEDPDKIYLLTAEIDAGLGALRARQVQYVVLKRYNEPDPSLRTLLAALGRGGTRLAEFSPYRADASAAERAGVKPFLHNADGRIDALLERPGPIIDIWRID